MTIRPVVPSRKWIALLLAACLSACAPSREDERPAPAPAPGAEGADVSAASASAKPGYEAPGLTPKELQARIAKGEPVLIVDVRSKGAYDAGHIAGAKHMPWKDLPEGHRRLPKDWLIALYCT